MALSLLKKNWSKVPLIDNGYHLEILETVAQLVKTEGVTVYPKRSNVFKALELTSFKQTKVVILGQDPYHGEGQAQGMAFSVPSGFPIPPSLFNIFKEVNRDVYKGKKDIFESDLTRWATQGVLLLNTHLTVEDGKPGSHYALGWADLTDSIIETLSTKRQHIVFMLWGREARAKARLIDDQKHLVLETTHPSPLSVYRGFYGCSHFGIANEYLKANGKQKIIW
jgi:uracil-DNA glycosylase